VDRVTADSPRTEVVEPLSLLWRAPDGSPRSLRLRDGAVSVGAHPSNDVALEDRFVSAFHFRLHEAEGRWRVKDLGSTNGTWVDGLRVSDAELCEGARLRA
jgi:pSer/pThr/pTyr-binding forkhead associated (FHA) protein